MTRTRFAVAGDDIAGRRAARIILFSVVVPFTVTAAFAVWRLGQDARDERASELIAVAESTAGRIAVGFAGGGTAADSAIRSDGRPAGFTSALFNAADRWRNADPPAAAADPFPAQLPAAIIARLESLDASFAITLDGRITAIAPVRDADQWDMVAALAVRADARDPARIPPRALLFASIALAFLILAAHDRRVIRVPAAAPPGAQQPLDQPVSPAPQYIPPAHPTTPAAASSARIASPAYGTQPGRQRRARPGLVLVGAAPAAFAIWLASTPPAGSHGFMAVVLFAVWAVPAIVGLGLAPLAERPLALREAAHAWAFLAPSLVHLLLFSIGPILFALWLSFHEWNLLDTVRPFVGLDNYRELAADRAFWRAVGNTAVYVLFVPAGMIVALAIALLVNQRIPGVRLLRAVLFLPYITSFVAISLVWRWMFQPDIGLFNNLLGRIGIAPQPWLSSPASALPSLMLMSIWMYTGYMMIIFLAGLQSIPESLYESARIDGAGPWRRLRSITLPMLRPTLLFILVTMIIFMFQVFTAVYVMTEGGPLHATDVIVYHIYRAAWEYLRLGYASAMAWVLFTIVFLVTLVQFRWLGGRQPQ